MRCIECGGYMISGVYGDWVEGGLVLPDTWPEHPRDSVVWLCPIDLMMYVEPSS